MPLDKMELAIRLILSIIFGGVIGIERESVNRPAGFRTHILVCVGSTLTMLVSIYIFEQYSSRVSVDPGRIAAQVVSGIGFLGAGTIIREGTTVRGLTTAASLWTVAAIGLAVGSGFYLAAFLTTVLTFLTLILFSRIENHIIQKRFLESIFVVIDDKPGQIGKIGSLLGELNVNIRNIKMNILDDGKISIVLSIRVPAGLKLNDIMTKLVQIDGVYNVEKQL
ncbi:MAG: MgtC/SapB family protein [Tepidanaerobacteraceae bacterium]|jgi:putative Mg2+ transporter-C (MgtC) family protein|nr:MgtC/SapB family protein [Tepidanaerobacteraceae bacterium]